MKIIADTNIWYEFAKNESLLRSIQNKNVSPTIVNIIELSKTYNLLFEEDLVRRTIRTLFTFVNNVIYEPPFVHVAKLHKEYNFDIVENVGIFLEITSRLAKGFEINKNDEFIDSLKLVDKPLEMATKFYNELSVEIKENNKGKSKIVSTREKSNRLQSIYNLLNKFTKTATQDQIDLVGFDTNKIELLVKVVNIFFGKIERHNTKFAPHDWNDLFILAYIQPGDKYWTFEKKWINLIKEAGCEEHLYRV